MKNILFKYIVYTLHIVNSTSVAKVDTTNSKKPYFRTISKYVEPYGIPL